MLIIYGMGLIELSGVFVGWGFITLFALNSSKNADSDMSQAYVWFIKRLWYGFLLYLAVETRLVKIILDTVLWISNTIMGVI